jgi:hypothetical protein
VGGFLIGMNMPTEYLFYIAAIPLTIGFINAVLLTPLYRAQLQQSGG